MNIAIRHAPVLIVLASVGALGTALVSQYGFDLHPCPLCIYQRIPYVVAGLIAAAAVVRPGLANAALALIAAAFAVNTGIALYHVGVEQHWWASAVCGGGLPEVSTANDLLSAMSARPEKACDEVDATLFGLSMATYNAVACAVLAAFAWVARQPRQQSQKEPVA